MANEIKKLAEKTKLETIKISETISSISYEVIDVIESNHLVEQYLEQGIKYTMQTKENNYQIKEIVTSTEEQLMAANEITKAANEIAENASAIESLGLDTQNVTRNLSNSLKNKLELVFLLSKIAKHQRMT